MVEVAVGYHISAEETPNNNFFYRPSLVAASEDIFCVLEKIWNLSNIWDNVFKSGLSKFCERQPLKKLKGYGLLKRNKQTISLQIF